MDLHPLTSKILDTGTFHLEELMKKHSSEELEVAEKELENLAAATAFSAAYVTAHLWSQDHPKAIRKANTVRRQVRKALGYTSTDDLPA